MLDMELPGRRQRGRPKRRTADDSTAVGTVVVSRLKMGEIEDGGVDHIATDAHQKCTLVCEPHGTTNDKDNGPLMNAVFKNPVCKVYRFQTTDSKWMLVREQMAECTLSFSIPIQLLRLFIQEDRNRARFFDQGLGCRGP
ncbi:hypothetical protein QTP70_005763 [Hemibagrus guttatus]|uniref:Uncharacterized protein n=1 Tax=Hemibagrus guttatus TaxID=175788 RepID=A0AAE0RG58_9TELE|nr:hypothetical protein QTP70_005763 [Hemibagrus guttatus]